MEDTRKMHRGRDLNEEASLSKECYYTDAYFEDGQLASYMEQIRLVMKTKQTEVLEIGKGSGFVSEYLKQANKSVVTIDINPNLEPDIIGDVTDLERIFKGRTFQTVLCAEVLEHLPFTSLLTALKNIRTATGDFAIITLPRAQSIIFDFYLKLKMPRDRYREISLFLKRKSSRIAEQHCWEIDSAEYSEYKKIKKVLEIYFSVIEDGRFRLNPYHYYFVLKPK